ncbi:hydroxymethylcytosylglucuronate/cytosylglucuronate synthase [Stackebrandtia endophytica]|uniref:Hydroxymethylcytosylglucuronate/cytosylglucurona te synthase n=1 Tax=Stackebrandtia endophytica TaxID=1496996 RepID=A0A543AZ89_9ACTN|nr:hypothetical protein [Stackebrandtia endophytica]TQL77895.1 hydroxymethylcytosylglucuronate/cytosylglucuronate synthase [Stackebrandtia endophytica]
MTVGPQPVLLASVCDFGWGSVGKLRLILDELSGVDVVLDRDSSVTEVATGLLSDRHRLDHREPAEASVALVINDPSAADRLSHNGLPVIYVDSLPYLWATEDETPGPVTVYCAQRWPGHESPRGGPLADRRDVEWINPIMPRARGRRGGNGAVVNVGGLHSHLVDSAADGYLRLAVLPMVDLLIARGHRVAAVCGNLPKWACRDLAELLPEGTAIGSQTPYEFESTLRGADLLVTSPGSTTILQAAGLGLPTMLLPPQNLSQILNAEIFAEDGPGVVHWPDTVLDRATVETLRPRGEEAVLHHVYSAIDRAAESPEARADTATRLAAGLHDLPAEGVLGAALVDGLGTDGARQIARRVRQALLAPHHVPARTDRATGSPR